MTLTTPPCNICGYQAKDQNGLDLHPEHSQPRFICEICDVTFRSKNVCVDHIMKKHSSKTFGCKGCSFAAKTKEAVVLHLWTKHHGQTKSQGERDSGRTVAKLQSTKRNARA